MEIKGFLFDDFIPCGLSVKLMRYHKVSTDLMIKVKEKIFIEHGNMSSVEADNYAEAMLQDDMELFEAYHTNIINIVQEFISFSHKIDSDYVYKSFSEPEVINAYNKITGLASTEPKKKVLWKKK